MTMLMPMPARAFMPTGDLVDARHCASFSNPLGACTNEINLVPFLLIISFRLGEITNRNTNTIRKILGRVAHNLPACVGGVSRACRSRLGFANFYCGRE